MNQPNLARLALALALLAGCRRPLPTTPATQAAPIAQLEWLVSLPWGEGNADGTGESARFSGPLVLTADPQGGLFIADPYAHTIRHANTHFKVRTLAGEAGVGAFKDGDHAWFHGPMGLAAAPDRTLYVADQQNNLIRKIAPSGEVSTFAGQPGQEGNTDGRGGEARFHWPTALALDAQGTLWVADQFNQALRLMDVNGQVHTWKPSNDVPSGPGLDNFPGISHLALTPDGSLVAAGDWGISRIRGNTVTVLLNLSGDSETSRLQPQQISGLAVRSDGAVFCSDASQGLVFELLREGETRVIAGRPGHTIGEEGPAEKSSLQEPGSLAFDTEDHLFVAHRAASIQQVSTDGTIHNVLGLARWYHKAGLESARVLSTSADRAWMNAQGHLLVLARLDGEIHEFDALGCRLQKWGKDTELGTPDTARHVDGSATQARFHYPEDLAPGLNGGWFVADGGSGTIRHIDAAGSVTTLAGRRSTPDRRDGSFANATFFRPHRLAFDGRNKLYVLDNSPYIGGGPVPPVIRGLDLTSHAVSTIRPALVIGHNPEHPFFEEFVDIAWSQERLYYLGKHGTLYAGKPGEEPRILLTLQAAPSASTLRDAQGQLVENNLIRSTDPFEGLERMAVDDEGYVYLSNGLADVILRLDPKGNVDLIVGTLGIRGNVPGPLPSSLEYPEGLSITPGGDLLITTLYSGVARIRDPRRVPGRRLVIAAP